MDGVEVSAAGDFERTAVRRQKIGFVFQRFNLFPTLTVRGNLEIARQIQGNGVPAPRASWWACWRWSGCPTRWT